MTAGYRCGTDRRRAAVRGSTRLNGIDYLVVAPDETSLEVHFLNELPGSVSPVPPPPAPSLTASNVVVDGGVRFTGIVAAEDPTVSGEVLTVPLDRPGFQPGDPMGDYSTYTFRLRTSQLDDQPPAGFDPQLSSVEFSFKAGCETDFDCGTEDLCPPETFPEPDIDYMAKDYTSFRQLMLDRMAVTIPAWRERNPADAEIALVEMLAYVGDRLSYFQDAVATETYLGTALKRRSIGRHARLLDYRMHQGCNARAWVCFQVAPGGPADGLPLPINVGVLTAGPASAPDVVDPSTLQNVVEREDPLVFETMTSVILRSAHNEIRFHTWDEEGCCLPTGSTSATFVGAPGMSLQPGDAIVFEEVKGPETGAAADADPAHRWAVRLTQVVAGTDDVLGMDIVDVAWAWEDALPFALCVSSRSTDGVELLEDVSVARGNVALADHGRTVGSDLAPKPSTDPVPSTVPDLGPYRPTLTMGPLTYAAPGWPAQRPATAAFDTDPADAFPAVTSLSGGGLSWAPHPDLLGSARSDPLFVVEMDADGTAHLRFGDGEHGATPVPGSVFRATYRIGNGRRGNVGPGSLTRLAPHSDLYAALTAGLERVWNPMSASGGMDPEPIERVKLLAPQAFRRQERAVTDVDYAEVTQRMPGVQQAAATQRWTGSWYTEFVTVDRISATAVRENAADFEGAVRRWLDLFRMAGTDVEIDAPVTVPLDVTLEVCVIPGYFAADVKRALLDALGSRILAGGRKGFFHLDNFTFGQPVYLSQIYEAALAVPGVSSVNASAFHRWGHKPDHELKAGVLTASRLEIVRLDNDPNFPENGRLEISMSGER